MGRILRIIWMILAPIVVFGGGYLLGTSLSDFTVTGLVIWGLCIVLNLPITIAVYVEDGDSSDKTILAYFIWVVILAPFWLIWQWILALIYLRD